VLDAYLKFKDGDKDDESYTYTISSDQVDAIKFMSTTKRLVVNATCGEYTVAASNQNEAISPTNIKISRETSFGIADVKRCGLGLPSCSRSARAATRTRPAACANSSTTSRPTATPRPDLTILSEHITDPGLVQGAFVASPDLMILVRAGGRARRCDDLRARTSRWFGCITTSSAATARRARSPRSPERRRRTVDDCGAP
jgi:hypothetical protein